MMLPTHALGGMVLALPFALAMPEFAAVALAAGLLGGVLPDFDLYAGHRKTLHYPVYYSALAAVTIPVATLVPTAATVAVAFLVLGAAAHSVTDVFGGGLELRPWEGTSERAVYDHVRSKWIAPRRWVRYDGSPEDLLLAVGLAVPLVTALDGPLHTVVIAAVAIGAVYTAVRRVLPAIAVFLIENFRWMLPDRAVGYVPARYVEGDGCGDGDLNRPFG